MQDANLYANVYQQILELLIEKGVDLTQVINLIDLGTGEGSHLNQLAQTWQAHVGNDQDQMPQFLGLDLAKDGILSAAKHYTNALWVVADLSQLPFKDGQVEGTITILSPSNYAELNRALSEQGWALKIVPGPNYLKELRKIILPVDEQKHDTSASIAKFKAAFNDFGQSHYQQYRPLNKEQIRDLIQMTPLMWHANESQMTEAMALDGITIDLQILFGRKKEKG
ncbi:MAG: methyltransferase domain-containing protein [Aerococcus urinaeequi]